MLPGELVGRRLKSGVKSWRLSFDGGFGRRAVPMAVESRVTQEEIKKEPEKPIDREKVQRRS